MRVSYTTAALVAALSLGVHAGAQNLGPSTQQAPYMVPSAPGVQTISLVSNGNGNETPDETYFGINSPYRLGGIPDGMGALPGVNLVGVDADELGLPAGNYFTMYVNHELNAGEGAVRAHGTTGAYVSQWVVNADTLEVVAGQDVIRNVKLWDSSSNTYVAYSPMTLTEAFSRLCSADLAAASAYYNFHTGKGTLDRIFTHGEESGDEGRAFATVLTGAEAGTSYELPWMGKMSFENVVASPYSQDKTIVAGLDDQGPGQVYFYVGQKQVYGNTVQQAGLTGGSLWGIAVDGVQNEQDAGLGGPITSPLAFTMVQIPDIEDTTGAQLDAFSIANGITNFGRPEDGVWDAANPNKFYFVTTGRGIAPSQLFEVDFNDITDPTAGGTVSPLLDPATDGYRSLDNMTAVVGTDGVTRILLQEDPGSSSRLAKLWLYDTASEELIEIAASNPTFFEPGAVEFLTTNEESSGIIPVWNELGEGWFLMSMQAHYDIDTPAELVEGGQLMAIYIPQAIPEPASLALIAAGTLMMVGRRRKD